MTATDNMAVSCKNDTQCTAKPQLLSNGIKRPPEQLVLGQLGQFSEMLTSFLGDSRSTALSALEGPVDVARLLNLSCISSHVLLDENRKQLAALGLMLKYSKDFGYIICDRVLSKLSSAHIEATLDVPVIGKNGMSIKLPGTLAIYKHCEPEAEGDQFLETAFIHCDKQRKPVQQVLIDEVQKNGFGLTDIDRCRSIAIDLDRSSSVWHTYRDAYGFVVNSPTQFDCWSLRCQDFVDRFSQSIGGNSGSSDEGQLLAVTPFSESEFLNLLQYDAKISGEYRKEFMRFLLDTSGSLCLIARGSHRIQGFAVYSCCSRRVYSLVAESESVGLRLLLEVCKESLSAQTSKTDQPNEVFQLQLFSQSGSEFARALSECANITRQVRRLYTAFIPTQISWGNVFVANCGLSLV